MVKVGVIGCGYWGPNLIRNFSKVPDCRLEAVADQKPKACERQAPEFRNENDDGS